MPTSAGSDTVIPVGTSYATIFDQASNGPLTAAGIEAAGSDRILVRYTTMGNKVRYLTVAAGDYKAFRARKSGLKTIEVKAANTSSIWFDALACDDF